MRRVYFLPGKFFGVASFFAGKLFLVFRSWACFFREFWLGMGWRSGIDIYYGTFFYVLCDRGYGDKSKGVLDEVGSRSRVSGRICYK